MDCGDDLLDKSPKYYKMKYVYCNSANDAICCLVFMKRHFTGST